MTRSIPHLFADITAALEDMHSIAIEGQRRDNALDMQVALAGHLREGVRSLDATVLALAKRLGGRGD